MTSQILRFLLGSCAEWKVTYPSLSVRRLCSGSYDCISRNFEVCVPIFASVNRRFAMNWKQSGQEKVVHNEAIFGALSTIYGRSSSVRRCRHESRRCNESALCSGADSQG